MKEDLDTDVIPRSKPDNRTTNMTTLANIKNDLEDKLEALLGEITPCQATTATHIMTNTPTKHRRPEAFNNMHAQCMGN